jgi:beta-1,4-mannosyl-glycoprotein beta-1,4-N-acetylglucosaminyltransferase
MKIFDCFMYFDEEIVLDLRLNSLDKFVDYFVIVESTFTHKGDKRVLKFNHKKFDKFKNKIIYLVYDKEPKDLVKIKDPESDDGGYILNALIRENSQRNFISKGLNFADDDDFILISDVDEIPNLENINFKNYQKKIIQFKQEMFYYKFNLKLPNLIWTGTKACKKKNLLNPQWLRNVKDKKYPFFRIDTLFSKTKYMSVEFVDDGGWHFSNIKSAEEIEYKLRSYLHHREFDVNPLKTEEIKNIINKRQAIYDLNVDKRVNKIGNGSKLEKYPTNRLPLYLQLNQNKFKKWID